MAAENLDTNHIDPTGWKEARTSFDAANLKQLMTDMMLEFVFLFVKVNLFTDFLVIVLYKHHLLYLLDFWNYYGRPTSVKTISL